MEGVGGVLEGGVFGELGDPGRGVWIGLECLGVCCLDVWGVGGLRVRVVGGLEGMGCLGVRGGGLGCLGSAVFGGLRV